MTLGAVPLVVSMARATADLATALIVLGLVAGASLGWIADDPTTEVLAPCPISGPRRMLIRSLLAIVTITMGAGVYLALAEVTTGLPSDWTERLAEVSATAAVACAAGLCVWRRGEPLGGVIGVSVGLLMSVTVAALAVRWPATLPTLMQSPTHSRWWIIAVAGLLAACYLGRDPARR